MASFQKACRAKWLWCLHVYSSTGRNTHTHPTSFSLRLTLEQSAHSWRRATRAEKKERKCTKKKHDASLSDLPGRAVCVCVCLRVCCSFRNSPSSGKNAQLQLFRFSPGHTLAEQWHLLCGCTRIFFFPSYCRVLSEGGRAHETAVWIWSNLFIN